MITLVELMDLVPRGADRFEGHSPDDGWRRIFGGLAFSQALMAAYGTIEGKVCHSAHGYFLRAGIPSLPVDYAVDRVRDGAGFSARRVEASQGGKPIFMLMASFQAPEPGPEHQYAMPDETPPEELQDEIQRWRDLGDALPEGARRVAFGNNRIEVRRPGPPLATLDTPQPPRRVIWMRAAEPLPDDPRLHQAALAYASDFTFLSTALAVHGYGFWSLCLQTASLDHALWLHRPTDFNEWHLFVQEAPSTGAGRGFVHGRMFRRDGVLVASMAQEGLIRPK